MNNMQTKNRQHKKLVFIIGRDATCCYFLPESCGLLLAERDSGLCLPCRINIGVTLSLLRSSQAFPFWNGSCTKKKIMVLYCRDKTHPLYGRRIRIERSSKPEGGIMYVDVLTGVPVNLEPYQLSMLPPERANEDDKKDLK
jgi:hypothetical protein